MEKDITKRVITIIFIAIATVMLVLAFVAVYKISFIKASNYSTRFSVYFDKASLKETTTGKIITDKDNTTVAGTNLTGRIALKEPGDSVVYTWDIINDGTADVKLADTPVILGLSDNDKQAIEYEIEINNLKAEQGYVIKKGDTANARLLVKYKANSPTVIDHANVQVVSLTLHFNQN